MKLLVLLALGWLAYAQPVVTPGGVVNAASYQPGIAQGSMFVIFGTGMGPGELARAVNLPLPSTLGGVTVRVSQGPDVRPVPLVYTSAGQIAAILPSDTPVGLNTLTVSYNGQSSGAVQFQVVRSQVGIFTTNSRGTGPAIVVNYVSQDNQPRNGISQAANPAQIVTIYGTGLGPIRGDDAAAAPAGDLDFNLQVLVGNKAANILYKGRSSCCAGIDQIVFNVPAGVEGCYVPLSVKDANGSTTQSSTMSIASSGSICTELGLLTEPDLEKARTQGDLRIGSMLLTSYQISDTQAVDYGIVSFSQARYADLVQTSQRLAASAAPAGACEAASFDGTSGTTTGNIGNVDASFFDDYLFYYGGAPLDAGANLSISGNGKSLQFQKAAPGFYGNALYDLSNPLTPFLTTGTYSFDNGSGGTDVPGFRTALNVPAPLHFNTPQSTVVSRGGDYSITWTGGSPDQRILAYGISYSQQGRTGGVFTCVQRGNAGKIVIPASVLSVLPPSGSITTGDGAGLLYLYAFSPYQRSDVPGLDAFYAAFLNFNYRLVQFQ